VATAKGLWLKRGADSIGEVTKDYPNTYKEIPAVIMKERRT
jgi:hypothetical protein